MFYFSIRELLNENTEQISLLVSFLFMMSAGLGLWTNILHLCVQCSDPGIVLPLKNDFSNGFKMHCLDLDEEELAAYNRRDPVYKNTEYY